MPTSMNGPVVGPAIERSRLGRKTLAGEVVEEDLLHHSPTVGTLGPVAEPSPS